MHHTPRDATLGTAAKERFAKKGIQSYSYQEFSRHYKKYTCSYTWFWKYLADASSLTLH